MIDSSNITNRQEIRALILDMDGVLWRGSQPVGDLPSIFLKISQSGLKTAFATNNTTRTVTEYVDIFRTFGVDVHPQQVITSGIATGLYLRRHYSGEKEIFIIGESGLVRTLSSFGFMHGTRDPKAVVVGLDRKLTYDDLRVATKLINSGCEFIGTNPDPTLPTAEGAIPGTGAILAAIHAATSVTPRIMGKPYPELFLIALERLGTKPEEALVIGDRIETDIAGGIAVHCPTALVLSGVTTVEQASVSPYSPTFISRDLASLLDEIT